MKDASENVAAYNFAYLDEQTKRMIRRAILKGLAIPGYQVPFASREMPMPYGWGTGGVQVTAGDADARGPAEGDRPGRRRHHQRRLDPQVLRAHGGGGHDRGDGEATLIQTRHRIPEAPLTRIRSSSIRCRSPSRCAFWSRARPRPARCTALEEYGLMHVKLYEDIARHGAIATAYAYPVKVEDRYVMDPSPIPKFDNPKLSGCAAIQLFGAGREQRIYALPPHTRVESLDFEDHPFEPSKADHPCGLCGAQDSYLDEVITDDAGGRMFVCSDTDYCRARRAAGHAGAQGAPYEEGVA